MKSYEDKAYDMLEAVLLFHSGGHWDKERRDRWRMLVGEKEASTRIMCDKIRELLMEVGSGR